jgi:ABC-type branched-subunit amino acid transport system substrate-binding protein
MSKLAWLFAVCAVTGSVACARRPAVDVPRPEQPPAEPAEPARAAPLRIGVIVSTTGSPVLQRYAQLVMAGIEVGAEAERTPRRAVELVVRDDGGTPEGAARAVRELEQAGVRVVIGPLVDEALAAAAAARTSDNTLLLSPTAVQEPAGTRNVYALNTVDTRGATALGEHARRYARVGVLYARTRDGSRLARAFIDAVGSAAAVHEAPFNAGATNVTAQLGQLREARVDALFVPGSERELQIVLPQVDYFRLPGVQLLGTETWLSEELRVVPQRMLEGAIVATPLWRESDDVAWKEFVQQYETRHRRSLDHPVPALGYDAARLAARALTGGTVSVRDYRGATGVLTLQSDSVTRRPFLVRIQAGGLVPVT